MVDSTVRFDGDVYTLVSPKSKPITKFFATIRPFQMNVWLVLCGTFIVSVVAFVLVSKTENKNKNTDLKGWKTITSAFFFCYCTLLAESVPQTYKMKRTVHATR